MGKISLSGLSSRDRTRLDKLVEQLEQAAPALRWRSAQLSVQEELIEIDRGDNIGSRVPDLKGPVSSKTKASL